MNQQYNYQFQSIAQYDPVSANRYLSLISDKGYLLSETRNGLLLSDLSDSHKKRIEQRIKLFSISCPSYCAVCLDSIPDPQYRLIKSDIYCCGNCRYIGKQILKEMEGKCDN